MQTQPCNSYRSVLLCFAFWFGCFFVCFDGGATDVFSIVRGPLLEIKKAFQLSSIITQGRNANTSSYCLFLLSGDDTLIMYEEHSCTTDKTFQILGRSLRLKCSSSEWCPIFLHSSSAKMMLTCAVLVDHCKRLAYHSLRVFCSSDRSLGH